MAAITRGAQLAARLCGAPGDGTPAHARTPARSAHRPGCTACGLHRMPLPTPLHGLGAASLPCAGRVLSIHAGQMLAAVVAATNTANGAEEARRWCRRGGEGGVLLSTFVGTVRGRR